MLALGAIVLAGCGSAASKHAAAGGMLQNELTYLPAGSPFVLSLSTSPTAASVKAGEGLVGRFPVASFGEQALYSKLSGLGISYQKDIRPLLGGPVSIGLAQAAPTSINGGVPFVIVWQTSSAAKLTALLTRIGVRTSGSYAGAKLYSAPGSTGAIAIAGPTLVFALNQAVLQQALARHANGGGFTTADYARLTQGLPQGSLLQAFGDLHGVLSTAKTAKARSIAWVGAIQGYGAAISATSAGLTAQFRLNTDGGTLTSSQLPIAAGPSSPGVAGAMPISVGLSDPAQALQFIVGVVKQTEPKQYASRLPGVTATQLNTLIAQLTGNGYISSDTKTTVACFALRDPAAATKALAQLSRTALFRQHGQQPKALGGGFYSIPARHYYVTIGVDGRQLLAGRASVAQLKTFAHAARAPLAGAQGSVAFRIALLQLLQLTLKHTPSGIAAALLSQLGDITGSTQASSSALTGRATLAVK